MYKIAVFVSGRGSNFKAVYNSINSSNAQICALVSDVKDCGAVKFAIENKVPVYYLKTKLNPDGFSFVSLAEEFTQKGIDLIVLAGFLKKIADEFVDAFNNKIINIHPALLPAFGGKGMYGHFVHEAVFNSTAKVSGATVHFVDKIYDNGKIIYQKCVNIQHCTNAGEIAETVLKVEHEILPLVVNKFIDNKIKIVNNRVIIED
ncbi:MAG: phosphoribosylglycinamide formyltransferase [Melioribacteraceae bacterium]|nr:phosphoribosylglycinamide formyltransferase [Melioribacteraceae bacterium]